MHKTISISLPQDIVDLLPELRKIPTYRSGITDSKLIRLVLEEALVYHLNYEPIGQKEKPIGQKVETKTKPIGLTDEAITKPIGQKEKPIGRAPIGDVEEKQQDYSLEQFQECPQCNSPLEDVEDDIVESQKTM